MTSTINELSSEELQKEYDYHEAKRLSRLVKEKSDGSTASYYRLPEGAQELQDLIDYKNMNYSVGNIFMLCYDHGEASKAYDVEKLIKIVKDILKYAEHEQRRLEKMYSL